MRIVNKIFFCLLTSACFLDIAVANAQQYPSRPIRFIVPFPPGGSTDLLARYLAPQLTQALGQTVVVDNRAGAGGVIGAELAARAPADGYTIVLGSPGPLTINPNLQRVPYDTLRDFSPITLATISPFTLVVHPSLPVNSVKDLLALAKAKPGSLNYGSAGNGSVGHFSSEQFKALAGVDIVHVPYKGSSAARTDILGGQVQMMFDAITTMAANARAGKVKALASTGKSRSSVTPDVPTLNEAGVPGYETTIWLGLMAPAATPRPILDRLSLEVNKVVHSPEVQAAWAKQGAVPMGMTVDQFETFLRADIVKWSKLVKETGMKVD